MPHLRQNILIRPLSCHASNGFKCIIFDLLPFSFKSAVGIVLWVQWLATGWTVLGSNPSVSEVSRIISVRSWDPPNLLHYRYRVSLPGTNWLGRGLNHRPTPILRRGYSRFELQCTSTPRLDLLSLYKVKLCITFFVCLVMIKNKSFPHIFSHDISPMIVSVWADLRKRRHHNSLIVVK